MLVALAAYFAFSLPHTVPFHWAPNPAPGLTGSEDVVNDVVLAIGLVSAAALTWGACRSADR